MTATLVDRLTVGAALLIASLYLGRRAVARITSALQRTPATGVACDAECGCGSATKARDA